MTDRREPIADIAPHRVGPWRPASAVEDLLKKLGPSAAWWDDQRARALDLMIAATADANEGASSGRSWAAQPA